MTDRYERIRAALAMGPTPGPWSPSYDKGSTRDIFTEQGKLPVCMVRGVTYVGQEQYLANGHFIAACDPDTIRALLAERDALEAENERLHEQLRLATVDQATAEAEANDARAEIEALLAEVERVTCELMDAITRADKLAEALRSLAANWDERGNTVLRQARDADESEVSRYHITAGALAGCAHELRAAIDQARGKGVAE